MLAKLLLSLFSTGVFLYGQIVIEFIITYLRDNIYPSYDTLLDTKLLVCFCILYFDEMKKESPIPNVLSMPNIAQLTSGERPRIAKCGVNITYEIVV